MSARFLSLTVKYKLRRFKMNRTIPIVIAIALVVLTGCATPAPTPTPGPELASSAEDIVGIWHRIAPGEPFYILFLEDGTMHGSTNPELVEDRPMEKLGFWFEGTQLYIKTISGPCPPDITGIYKVHLVATGNLRFELIQDECRGRASVLYGRGDYEGLVEWEPVP